jgi:hypothetical protein
MGLHIFRNWFRPGRKDMPLQHPVVDAVKAGVISPSLANTAGPA